MIVVFPIGGKGTRFLDAGYSIQKPLLPVGDSTLIQKAISSYPADASFLFVVKRGLILDLRKLLKGMPSKKTFIRVWKPTIGPVNTLLEAREELLVNQEVLVADCDSFLDPAEMQQALDYFRVERADGGVTVRETSDPHCSYAQIDESGAVLETREKDAFTSWSTTGPYWFRWGSVFYRALSEADKDYMNSISPVYNYLIKAGGKVVAYPVTSFTHLGTPAEYEHYCNSPHL